MENLFWVLVGAVLSFVAQIIANYFDASISKFLNSTRFYASERGRKKAMVDYKRALDFKEGRHLSRYSASGCGHSRRILF